MSAMTEDLLHGGAADNMRPAASLTSSMIKRRRPVRVATPEDLSSPQADAPVKAAQELAARVEAAFPGETAPSAPVQESSKVDTPKQNGSHVQTDALQARQQELRRLAAERAEAQRNTPLQTDAGSETQARAASVSDAPARQESGRESAVQPARDLLPQQNTHRDSTSRHDPNGNSAGGAPNNGAEDIHEIDSLRNGRRVTEVAPGARRKSLVQGGMTALERRRAALEHHRKLTEAQPQETAQPRDVATYWDELRRGRQVPSMIDVDPHVVAQHWPNSLLISCDDMNGAATLERSFAEVMRGARERAANQGEVVVEYTPMVTEWIMTVGREVARAGRPIQDIEVFPTSLGNVSYRVIALPLSGERLGTVHALCYISHA